MVTFSPPNKISVTFMLLLALSVICGLLLAHHAKPAVEREARAFVLDRRISGYSLVGRVTPEQIEVFSEIDCPFIVTGGFTVPRDLHASYYRTRYLVMPWGRYVISKDAFPAV
jgi:hypothetical protein